MYDENMVKEDILNDIKKGRFGILTIKEIKNILLKLSKQMPPTDKKLSNIDGWVTIDKLNQTKYPVIGKLYL